MISLSSAILRGAERAPSEAKRGRYFEAPDATDILGAAVLGQLPAGAVMAFWERIESYSHPQLCAFMLHDLHQKWPDLGRSVRTWPRMAEDLEADRLIPRLIPHQTTHRPEIHVSLWKVLVDRYHAGESRESIAAWLGRFGL